MRSFPAILCPLPPAPDIPFGVLTAGMCYFQTPAPQHKFVACRGESWLLSNWTRSVYTTALIGGCAYETGPDRDWSAGDYRRRLCGLHLLLRITTRTCGKARLKLPGLLLWVTSHSSYASACSCSCPAAALGHELVELGLVLGHAQSAEEVLKITLLLFEPSQCLGAIFIER